MSDRKHFKITLGPSGHHSASSVEMDGVKLTNVCGVRVDATVNTATTVSLDFINVDVNIEQLAPVVEVSDFDSLNKEWVRSFWSATECVAR